MAQTAKEEREREKAAAHTMTIATAYILGASRSYPIKADLKENIQNATVGKIGKLAPAGRCRRRWRRRPEIGITRANNTAVELRPARAIVDLINMPYFAAPISVAELVFRHLKRGSPKIKSKAQVCLLQRRPACREERKGGADHEDAVRPSACFQRLPAEDAALLDGRAIPTRLG